MRTYKVVKSGLDKDTVIGQFAANDDMSTFAFVRVFHDFVIRAEGHAAWHGYRAVPLCEDCGEMLTRSAVKRQVYEGEPDPWFCDACEFGKGQQDESKSERDNAGREREGTQAHQEYCQAVSYSGWWKAVAGCREGGATT